MARPKKPGKNVVWIKASKGRKGHWRRKPAKKRKAPARKRKAPARKRKAPARKRKAPARKRGKVYGSRTRKCPPGYVRRATTLSSGRRSWRCFKRAGYIAPAYKRKFCLHYPPCPGAEYIVKKGCCVKK